MRVRAHHGIYGSIFLLLFFIHTSYCWQTIACKDALRANSSFSFPIQTYSGLADVTYCYSVENGNGKEYALSFLKESENTIKPYAPEKIKVDGVKNQSNPLYNSGFWGITNLDEHNLLLVLNSECPKVCGLSFVDEAPEVLTLASLSDARGQAVDQPICALAGGKGKAFLAVKGHGQKKFGDDGTGIAMVVFNRAEIEEEVPDAQYQELKKRAQEQDQDALEEITHKITTDKDGTYKKKSIVKKIFQQNCMPIAVDLFNEKFKTDLTHIGDAVALHWNDSLQCLYVGLQVQAAADQSSKAIGLFVCHIDDDHTLRVSPFISSSLVGADQIIACKGSDAQVSIHKISSMFTTTSLNYCIVLAGAQTSGKTKRSVYALPIMNFRSEKGDVPKKLQHLHGTMANYKAVPEEIFSANDRLPLFIGRYFDQAPTCPEEICMMHNACAQVGAGPLAAGPIDDIFVVDDAVHAIVNSPEGSGKAGVYYSQAIFDHSGRIAAWTQWQLKALTHDHEISSARVMRVGASMQVTTARDIKRTAWEKNEDESLSGIVNKEFPKSSGGIHTLLDFAYNTPGITHPCIAIVGSHKVMLADYTEPVSTVTFSDAVLETLSPLSTIEIGANATSGWLFVGGVHGLGVLCNTQGKSWDVDSSRSYFSQIQDDVRFKKIGDYQFVRKIIADYPFLYVLTDTQLDRISMDESDFSTGVVHVTRLATMHEFAHCGIFKDVIISEKLALLATSQGLYRVGNGKDIRVDCHNSLQWTPVEIPGAVHPVCSMWAVSVNGRAQDIARSSAGNIYIVTGSPGKDVCHVYRCAVACVTDASITDDTLRPLASFITPDTPSYFANVGNFSSLFATDGTFYFTKSIVRRYKIKKQVLVNNFSKRRCGVPINLDNDAIITCIARNSAQGNWMVGGDFGLFINE